MKKVLFVAQESLFNSEVALQKILEVDQQFTCAIVEAQHSAGLSGLDIISKLNEYNVPIIGFPESPDLMREFNRSHILGCVLQDVSQMHSGSPMILRIAEHINGRYFKTMPRG
jgi:hypothetical protein